MSESVLTTKKEIVKRNKWIEKTADELQEIGLVDYDLEEEETDSPDVPQIPAVSPKIILKILKDNNRHDGLYEVGRATAALKGYSLTTKQASVIAKSFYYETIHTGPFLLEIFLQISDKENLETLAKDLFTFDGKIKDFMDKVEACYPNGLDTQTQAHEQEQENIYAVTIRETLTPLAKISLVSIPLLIISNVILLIILLF